MVLLGSFAAVMIVEGGRGVRTRDHPTLRARGRV